MVRRLLVVVVLLMVSCAAVDADSKSPAAEGHNSASVEAASDIQSVERRSVDDENLESLVGSSRALRNSYVRFGRSAAAAASDSLEATDADKRSKHYVRFGRDAGRHYVRFGRSVGAEWDGEEDELTDNNDKRSKHYVRFGRDAGRHYVRFGRSSVDAAEDTDDVDALVDGDSMDDDLTKRSGAKHYVRFGRSVDSQLEEEKRAGGASKHYVRFGRSGSDLEEDKRSAGKHYVRFGRSGASQDALELDELDKRSGKHYVRFGRTAPAATTEDDVDKRSKHYVRFGRSGQLERLDAEADKVTDDAAAAAADKRANYVRFG